MVPGVDEPSVRLSSRPQGLWSKVSFELKLPCVGEMSNQE
jgi:hypothetical protein